MKRDGYLLVWAVLFTVGAFFGATQAQAEEAYQCGEAGSDVCRYSTSDCEYGSCNNIPCSSGDCDKHPEAQGSSCWICYYTGP